VRYVTFISLEIKPLFHAAPSDLSDRSFELCNFNQAQFYPSLRLRNWRDKVLLRMLVSYINY